MDIFHICFFIILLTRTVDARCKHHVTCPECVSDSKCQWSLFSAVYESSSKQVRSNECHASPTTFHGRTAKQFPVRPGSDELSPPISWANNIMECPPSITKEQYETVRGLSVLDAVSMLSSYETGDEPNAVRIPFMVLKLAHYITTVTTPSSIKFTAYEPAQHVMRTSMTDDEFKIRRGYGYVSLDYIEVMRLQQLFAYTAPSGNLCDMPEGDVPSSERVRNLHASLLRRRMIVRNSLLFLRHVYKKLNDAAVEYELRLGEWPRDLFWNDRGAASSIMSLDPPKSFQDLEESDVDVEGIAYFTVDGQKVYSDRLSVVKRLLDRYEQHAVNIKATDEDMKSISDSIVCGNGESEEEMVNMLNSVTLPYWYHASNAYMNIIQAKKIDIEYANANGRLGPGVYLSTIPEMDGSPGVDEYGPVAFAIDTKDARDAFGASLLEKNPNIDEVWGSFHTISKWAYAIYNDRPNPLRRLRKEFELPHRLQAQKHTKLVPISEALMEREIVRLATILTPGGHDRWSLKSMIGDRRTRVLGDTSREQVPISWSNRLYMKIVNAFWYFQRRREYGRRANTAAYFGWDTWGRSVYDEVERERQRKSERLSAREQENADRKYNEKVRSSSIND